MAVEIMTDTTSVTIMCAPFTNAKHEEPCIHGREWATCLDCIEIDKSPWEILGITPPWSDDYDPNNDPVDELWRERFGDGEMKGA